MEVHAIQLEHVGLSNINFIAYRSGSTSDKVEAGRIDVNFSYSPYNEDTKMLVLMGQATIGDILDDPTEEDAKINPFYLYVQLHGFFIVDDTKFDTQYANDFASRNAPSLMYPFLREHVYSIAIRCGYPNVMIPLIKIPRIKAGGKSEKDS